MSYYPNYYQAAQDLNEQTREAFLGDKIKGFRLADKFGAGHTRSGAPYSELDPRYVPEYATAWGWGQGNYNGRRGGFVHRRASRRKASRRASDRKASRRKASRRR